MKVVFSDPIVFLVTGAKGLACVKLALREFAELSLVFVAARNASVQNDYYEQIRNLCIAHGVAFFDRKDFRPDSSSTIIAISWRWLISVQPEKLIVLHDSLLPKYRGFNPLVTALINGDRDIGVTALVGAEKYDCGDILSQAQLSISYPITIAEATELITGAYVEVVRGILENIKKEIPCDTYPQDEASATYSLWRDEFDYRIDWALDSTRIKRHVDAVGFPYSGASAVCNGQLLRIFDVDLVDDVVVENRDPGKVIFMQDGLPIVVCGRGLLLIKKASWEDSGESMIPLQTFRLRFL